MIEQNLIKSKSVKTLKYAYFGHYKTKEENICSTYNDYILSPFSKNIEELSKNDWELHKKLIKEGINPNEIAKIFRYDEIEKLQKFSSQSDFDFNQVIESSIYEKCSFINRAYIPLIDYSAFFGSIKCFKYLLLNNANINSAGKYAVASGNLEIIHLCEQNHSTFKGAYKTAIMFHQNDILKYIFENKLEKINNLKKLGVKCIFIS